MSKIKSSLRFYLFFDFFFFRWWISLDPFAGWMTNIFKNFRLSEILAQEKSTLVMFLEWIQWNIFSFAETGFSMEYFTFKTFLWSQFQFNLKDFLLIRVETALDHNLKKETKKMLINSGKFLIHTSEILMADNAEWDLNFSYILIK